MIELLRATEPEKIKLIGEELDLRMAEFKEKQEWFFHQILKKTKQQRYSFNRLLPKRSNNKPQPVRKNIADFFYFKNLTLTFINIFIIIFIILIVFFIKSHLNYPLNIFLLQSLNLIVKINHAPFFRIHINIKHLNPWLTIFNS